MKAVDVLRAEKRPQAFDKWGDGMAPDATPEKVCAAGALYRRLKWDPNDFSWEPDWDSCIDLQVEYPELLWEDMTACPARGCKGIPLRLEERLEHLNDCHKWTFAQIADWLEKTCVVISR